VALFANRSEAGRKLARDLLEYKGRNDVVVLALPRGGVPVAYEVALELNAPLDVFLVRKLGVPGHEELAMGAIASGGVRVLNTDVLRALDIPGNVIDAVAVREQRELERREQEYRDGRAAPDLNGKIVILIDDGLATGASMRAAVQGVRAQNPAKIVVAVPTGAPETCAQFEQITDQVVCDTTPEPFYGVGVWYEDFGQTSDAEVRELLKQAASTQSR
jgi:predicted phosphoribosyltransferase